MLKLKILEFAHTIAASDVSIERPSCLSVGFGDPNGRFAKSRHGQLCYWRLVGKDNQDLLSLDLEFPSGWLFSLELLAYSKPVTRTSDCHVGAAFEQKGIPKVDISRWEEFANHPVGKQPSSLVDNPVDFSVTAGKDVIEIRWAHTEPQRFLVGHRVWCEVDYQGCLSGCGVFGLSSAEIGMFLGQ